MVASKRVKDRVLTLVSISQCTEVTKSDVWPRKIDIFTLYSENL